LADNLVAEPPEEDGVDHRVEPPMWLPEGGAPDAEDEVTPNGTAQASGGGEADSVHSVNEADAGGPGDDTGTADSASTDPDGTDVGGTDVTGADAGRDSPGGGTDLRTDDGDVFHAAQKPVSAETGPLEYGQAGQTGLYAHEQDSSYGYQQESPYSAEYGADSGYNHDVMSKPAGQDSPPVPPYPAEVPSQPANQTAGVSTLATAAYRAIPRPKLKSKSGRPREAARSRDVATTARRANLVVARFEPWSVMKFSFLMSLVAWVMLFVAVALLYYTLSAVGVFAALQRTLESVTSSQTSAGVDLSKWTSASRVLGYTMLIGAVNIVLITALSTVGAMIYNLVTHLGGGVEVTLKETD
jgi:Transmembrane domain of unknown function (DUF3566)